VKVEIQTLTVEVAELEEEIEVGGEEIATEEAADKIGKGDEGRAIVFSCF